MKHLRVIFVSLIAVGVCGGVYIGLTVGLAAYMSYKTGGVAHAVVDSPATAPDAPKVAAPAEPAPPTMEDAASVLRRTWTAYRPGLSSSAGVLMLPVEGRERILPAEQASWRPAPGAELRTRHRLVTGPYVATPRPSAERAPIPVELTVAAPEVVVFAAIPPVRATPPETAVVRASLIGVDRSGERPAVERDVTLHAGEAMLVQRAAPQRSTPAAPERLSIPNPTPNDIGPVRTSPGDEALPPIPADRPEQTRFPVK